MLPLSLGPAFAAALLWALSPTHSPKQGQLNPPENNWISCLKLLHSAYGDLHLVPGWDVALVRSVRYKHDVTHEINFILMYVHF